MNRPEVTAANYDAFYSFYETPQGNQHLLSLMRFACKHALKEQVSYEGDARDQLIGLLEADTRIIVSSNHSFWLDQNLVDTAFQRDPSLAATTGNAFILAKPKHFQGWKKRLFFDAANAVPVFRAGDAPPDELFEPTRRFLSVVTNRVVGGENVFTFPEGTRNKDATEKLQEVKDGAAAIAIRAAQKVPIAVVAVGIYYGAGEPKLKERFKASLFVCQPEIVTPTTNRKELASRLEQTQTRALNSAIAMDRSPRKI